MTALYWAGFVGAFLGYGINRANAASPGEELPLRICFALLIAAVWPIAAAAYLLTRLARKARA